MALHLPIGPLKTRSGLEPVPRCEPSTYQPISRWHNHCTIGAGFSQIDWGPPKWIFWIRRWLLSNHVHLTLSQRTRLAADDYRLFFLNGFVDVPLSRKREEILSITYLPIFKSVVKTSSRVTRQVLAACFSEMLRCCCCYHRCFTDYLPLVIPPPPPPISHMVCSNNN